MRPYEHLPRGYQKLFNFPASETPYTLKPHTLSTIWDIPMGTYFTDPHIGFRRGQYSNIGSHVNRRTMTIGQQTRDLRKQYFEACYRLRTGKTGDPKLHFQSSFSGMYTRTEFERYWNEGMGFYIRRGHMTVAPYPIRLTPLSFLREYGRKDWLYVAQRRTGKSLSMHAMEEMYREKLMDTVRLPLPSLNMLMVAPPRPRGLARPYVVYDYIDSLTLSYPVADNEITMLNAKIRGVTESRSKKRQPFKVEFKPDIDADIRRWARR